VLRRSAATEPIRKMGEALHAAAKAMDATRAERARLAAILPAPLKRRPNRMDHYSAIIQERMRAMGW
jgi:hypothetical protein